MFLCFKVGSRLDFCDSERMICLVQVICGGNEQKCSIQFNYQFYSSSFVFLSFKSKSSTGKQMYSAAKLSGQSEALTLHQMLPHMNVFSILILYNFVDNRFLLQTQILVYFQHFIQKLKNILMAISCSLWNFCANIKEIN